MWIFRFVCAAVLSALVLFFFMPVLSPGYLGFWITVFFIGAAAFIPAGEETLGLRLALGAGSAVAFVLISIALTWGAFHSGAYRDQIGAETQGDFNRALPPIDIDEAPLVSVDMAERAAEKQLADVPALGSQVVLGPMQKQLIHGKLYWVAFLEHTSFIKWWATGSTPGYVKVSAVDVTDVTLVTKIADKDMALRYLPSASFGDNLARHLYLHGYAGRGIAAVSPEVDETGYPYYVVTFYKNTIGFGGAEANDVAIVDPQTGSIKHYAMKDAPAWADILEAPDMVKAQVDNHLQYVHGYWNFAGTGKLQVTGDPDLVYGADQRAYWYIGVTSSGNDNGLVGFYLIDSRTKAAHRFVLSGATEEVAQHSAEGVIPEKHYSATNPLPFVVAGRPTYVFSLRDGSGIPRAYAMVNIQTYQSLAVGETLPATLRQYEAVLSRDPTATAGTKGSAATVMKQGLIVRIAPVVRQGTTYYMLSLDTAPGRVMVASADLSDALPLAQPKDAVSVSYEANDHTHVYNLTHFSDPTVLPPPPVTTTAP